MASCGARYHMKTGKDDQLTVITSRRLSSRDLVVVHEVPEQRRTQYVEFVKTRTTEIDGPWKKVLCSFLHTRTLPSVPLIQQRSNICLSPETGFPSGPLQQEGDARMGPEVGSSSRPMLVEDGPTQEGVEDVPAQGNPENNPTILLPEGDESQPSHVVVPNTNVKLPAKRKLPFEDMDEADDPAPVMANASSDVHESGGTVVADAPSNTNDADSNQPIMGIEHLEDDDYVSVTDFGIVGREGNLQPLPFIDSYVPPLGSEGDFSKSPYNMIRIIQPDINSPEISAFINDCGQPLDYPSSSQALPEATPSMDASKIEKMFLTTAYQVVQTTLHGLNITTLREPEHCANLQTTSASLPGNFASIISIKTMLDKLIDISKQLQAHSEFEASSGQVDQTIAAVQRELSAKKHALEITTQEIVSVEKRKTEISEKIANLNTALQEQEKKKQQLLGVQATQLSEVKEQEQTLCDATTEASKKANDNLQAKTMVPVQDAEKLLADLHQFISEAT